MPGGAASTRRLRIYIGPSGGDLCDRSVSVCPWIFPLPFALGRRQPSYPRHPSALPLAYLGNLGIVRFARPAPAPNRRLRVLRPLFAQLTRRARRSSRRRRRNVASAARSKDFSLPGQIIADPRDQIEINSRQITRRRSDARRGSSRRARVFRRKSPRSLLTHSLMFPFRRSADALGDAMMHVLIESGVTERLASQRGDACHEQMSEPRREDKNLSTELGFSILFRILLFRSKDNFFKQITRNPNPCVDERDERLGDPRCAGLLSRGFFETAVAVFVFRRRPDVCRAASVHLGGGGGRRGRRGGVAGHNFAPPSSGRVCRKAANRRIKHHLTPNPQPQEIRTLNDKNSAYSAGVPSPSRRSSSSRARREKKGRPSSSPPPRPGRSTDTMAFTANPVRANRR